MFFFGRFELRLLTYISAPCQAGLRKTYSKDWRGMRRWARVGSPSSLVIGATVVDLVPSCSTLAVFALFVLKLDSGVSFDSEPRCCSGPSAQSDCSTGAAISELRGGPDGFFDSQIATAGFVRTPQLLKACGLNRLPLGSASKRRLLISNRRVAAPRMGLTDWLRGGGGFKRETNQAKFRSRPKLGIQIGSKTATMLSLLGLGLVSTSLPVWGTAAGLTSSFWLTRIVFLRALGFVYFVAFLVSFKQNPALIGDEGLLPVKDYLRKIRMSRGYPKTGMTWEMFEHVPTLLWLANENKMNQAIKTVSGIGMAFSAAVAVLGASNVFIQLSLWVLYHSIVNVGQRWYGFGWESQLLETGFISVLMVPLLSLSPFPAAWPASWVSIWALRWLTFRIMLGAGMIKIRGDSCWRDLTAMHYHYETQPVPNPFSYYFHHTPGWFHKFETMSNHIIELIFPFFAMLPWRPLLLAGGLVQLLFQAVLIMSGNLSFLNWLTMLPPIMCLDDGFLSPLFSTAAVSKVLELNQEPLFLGAWSVLREGCYAAAAALILWLSAPVIQNILSPHQVMNTSFGSWRLVNTYGAFGSITREREEVILQGTHHDFSKAWKDPEEVEWREYHFKVKPGDLKRCPPWISPYHYRLDWLMWFLPFGDSRRNPWLYHLLGKLLVNDRAASDLIATNPFQNDRPPKYIRAELFLYRYTKPGSPEARAGEWWTRSKVRSLVAPTSLPQLKPVYQQFSWPFPKVPSDSDAELSGSVESTSSAPDSEASGSSS